MAYPLPPIKKYAFGIINCRLLGAEIPHMFRDHYLKIPVSWLDQGCTSETDYKMYIGNATE